VSSPSVRAWRSICRRERIERSKGCIGEQACEKTSTRPVGRCPTAVYVDYRSIVVSALAARSPDLLGRSERSSPCRMAARRRRGLDGEDADRAIINVTAMRVVGHCPRGQVPDFTLNATCLTAAFNTAMPTPWMSQPEKTLRTRKPQHTPAIARGTPWPKPATPPDIHS
jgi:hypothetical protein